MAGSRLCGSQSASSQQPRGTSLPPSLPTGTSRSGPGVPVPDSRKDRWRLWPGWGLIHSTAPLAGARYTAGHREGNTWHKPSVLSTGAAKGWQGGNSTGACLPALAPSPAFPPPQACCGRMSLGVPDTSLMLHSPWGSPSMTPSTHWGERGGLLKAQVPEMSPISTPLRNSQRG